MAILSDHIEAFIKSMLEEYDGIFELQRNELAEYFRCAPSQINYVLATRFPPERGYLIESHRGGGGYIKLTRIDTKSRAFSILAQHLAEGEISAREAKALIDGLAETNQLGAECAKLMSAALSDKALMFCGPVKDHVRATIFREMLKVLLKEV